MMKKSGLNIQQVRFKKRVAYPKAYRPAEVPLSHPKKDHSSVLQRQLRAWLGPKNIRGEYTKNKYYYPPSGNKPRYIVVDGNTLPGEREIQGPDKHRGRDSSLHPFPTNLACKTASMVSNELRSIIYERHIEQGEDSVVLASQYKMKIARIEALAKLHQIELKFKEENKITNDMEKFARVMTGMFPVHNTRLDAENLTEIPTPHKTLNQRFLTISESEPFGPVDAANIFGLDPAETVLNRIKDHVKTDEQKEEKTPVVVGEQREGDKCVFKFIKSQSGKVGFRYGASRRDRKKDRKISFDKEGRMVYSA